MKTAFSGLFLSAILVLLPAVSSDVQAATPWPTTRFKVDFAKAGDATAPGQATAPVITEPGRKPSVRDPEKGETEENRQHRIASHAVLALYFEESLQDAAEALMAAGFEPPGLPLYSDGSGTYYKVYVYDFPKKKGAGDADADDFGVYHSGTECGDRGISTKSWFAVDAGNFVPLTPSAEAFLYIVLAHELVHTIQESYGATSQALFGCSGHTEDEENVSEGSADAVAYKLASRHWPEYYQVFSGESTHGEKGELTVRRFNGETGLVDPELLGHRSYETPFLDKSAFRGVDLDDGTYQTSSFWYNVIDRFGIRFIDHLYRQPLRYGDYPSLVRWLDDALESYLPGTSGLYIIFPHFITEFSSHVGSRIPGEHFGIFAKEALLVHTTDPGRELKPYRDARKWWIRNILGECEYRELNAFGATEATISIELDRLSAGCIEISWEGFDENFELDFELESSDLGLADQLHFGLVYEENREEEKFCYDWVRTDYDESLKTCLHEKPFIKSGPQQLNYIKEWAEVGMRFTGTGRRIIAISNVAKRAGKTRPVKKDDGVKLRVGIIRARGEDGREYDPPNAGPGGTGSVSAGPETLYGITRHPTSASTRLSFSIPVKDSDLAYGAQWAGEAPPLGFTGPYRGTVSKSSSGKRAIGSSFCRRHADGVVGQVTRFDRDHLRVDIEADLCEMTIPPPANGHFPKVDELKVSLQMPFGWRYSAGNAPVDIVTPGMQVYIDRHSKRLPMVLSGEWQNPGSTVTGQPTSQSPGGSGTGQGPAAGSSGTSSTVSDCNCSCEEYRELTAAGEAAGRGEGDEITNKLVGRMMSCVTQCQTEYMICQLDMDESEAAARVNERQQTSVSECDCSCAGLRSLESRLAGLGNKLQSGDMAAMGEMQKLGECMSVCQAGFSGCMPGR